MNEYVLRDARRATREARERFEWKSAMAHQSREHAADAEAARLALREAEERLDDLQRRTWRR